MATLDGAHGDVAAVTPNPSSAGGINCVNVDKWFGSELILADLRLAVEEHEFVCIVGPSGCGKTTLLRMAAGLAGAMSPMSRCASGSGTSCASGIGTAIGQASMLVYSLSTFTLGYVIGLVVGRGVTSVRLGHA